MRHLLMLRQMVEKLPEECSVEDMHYQLYLLEKVRRGLKSIDEGKGIAHDQIGQTLCQAQRATKA